MRRKSEVLPDPQVLLPEGVREKWAVVPRFELYQASIMMAVIGAGTALTFVGIVQGPSILRYGFPLALLIGYIQAKIFGRWSNRLLAEMKEHLDD